MKMIENKYLEENAPITMKAARLAESEYGISCYIIHANAGVTLNDELAAVSEIIAEFNLDKKKHISMRNAASMIYNNKCTLQKMQHVADEIMEISKQYGDNTMQFINTIHRVIRNRICNFQLSYIIPCFIASTNVIIIIYDNTWDIGTNSDLDCAERIQGMLVNAHKISAKIPFASLTDDEKVEQLAQRIAYRISWVGAIAYQKLVRIALKDPEIIDKINDNILECNFGPKIIVVDKRNTKLYQILNTMLDEKAFRNQDEYHDSPNETDEFVDIINFLISNDELCCTTIALYGAQDDPDTVDRYLFDVIIIDADISDEKLHELCVIYANAGRALNRVVSDDQYGPDSHITSFDMFKTVLARVKGDK